MMYRKLNFMALSIATIKLFAGLIEVRYLKFLTYSLISEQAPRNLIANYALVTEDVLQKPSACNCILNRLNSRLSLLR